MSGGLAFSSWLTGDKAGDFVLTLGGYHPAFKKPAHYPTVPRLAVRWQVDPHLAIKGDAYFALTGAGLMAGGQLEAAWQSDHLRAYFKAKVDFLVAYQPYFYDAFADVQVAAAYTFELFGTHTISAELSARLHVWGPPFAGEAHLDLHLFSVDVAFGGDPTPKQTAISWQDFTALVLPERAGAPQSFGSVAISSGLLRSRSSSWMVSPQELALVVDSVVPLKAAKVGVADKPVHANVTFGIAPMAADASDVRTALHVTLTRGGVPVEHDFVFEPVTKRYPTGLWGESVKPKLGASGFIEGALAGFTIRPAAKADKLAPAVTFPLESSNGAAPKEMTLHAFDRPALAPGEYAIEVTHEIRVRGVPQSVPSVKRAFSVAGERFAMKPSVVHAAFPPQGSLGERPDVLPHLVLDASTWPWERRVEASLDAPWLALLLFDEGEEPKPSVVTLGTLTSGGAKFRFDGPEAFEELSEKVTVIDVPWRILEGMMPTSDELELLTHVRRAPEGALRTVLLANRSPKGNARSIVHLVSVENRFTRGRFDAQGAGPNDAVRLVSLYSWSFSCLEDRPNFNATLSAVDRVTPVSYRVSLPHTRRDGTETMSPYRGPLLTQRPADPRTTDAADALSYDVAAQLGHVLALQSPEISSALVRSRRARERSEKREEQRNLDRYKHLYTSSSQVALPPLPDAVTAWMRDLLWFKGIPMRYLVPDESMLPKESVRFFWVDGKWLDRLIDGAESLGQPRSRARFAPFSGQAPLTGVLLRSNVVAGFPGLIVHAPDRKGGPLRLQTGNVRVQRVADDTLLVLSDGEITGLDLSLAPETLHFAVEPTTPRRGGAAARGVIDLASIRGRGAMSSADLAKRMIQKPLVVKLDRPDPRRP